MIGGSVIPIKDCEYKDPKLEASKVGCSECRTLCRGLAHFKVHPLHFPLQVGPSVPLPGGPHSRCRDKEWHPESK